MCTTKSCLSHLSPLDIRINAIQVIVIVSAFGVVLQVET